MTPCNTVIKQVSSVTIPEFRVDYENTKSNRKMMIDDRYVACFLKICKDWYVILRLFGHTNIPEHGLDNPEQDRAFYKLANGVILNTARGLESDSYIKIDPSKCETPPYKYTALSTSSAPSTKIQSKYVTHVTSTMIVNGVRVFNVLDEFREQKLFASEVKRLGVELAAMAGIDYLISGED